MFTSLLSGVAGGWVTLLPWLLVAAGGALAGGYLDHKVMRGEVLIAQHSAEQAQRKLDDALEKQKQSADVFTQEAAQAAIAAASAVADSGRRYQGTVDRYTSSKPTAACTLSPEALAAINSLTED